jgi:hypothetical protein
MKILSLSLFFLVSIVGTVLNGQANGLLPMAKPEAVGLDPKKLEAVNEKMEALIEDNRLTGGTVVIARKGKVAHFEILWFAKPGGGINGREGYDI